MLRHLLPNVLPVDALAKEVLLRSYRDEEWQRCFRLDLDSAWTCSRAVLPLMLKAGSETRGDGNCEKSRSGRWPSRGIVSGSRATSKKERPKRNWLPVVGGPRAWTAAGSWSRRCSPT